MDDHAHINNQIRSDMYPLPRQIEAGIEAESVTASELFAAVVRWIHHDVADDDLAQLSRDLVVDEQRGRSPLWAARRFPDGSLAAACYFRRLPGNVATLGGARQAQSSVSEKPSDLSECLAACLRRGAALGIGQIQAILPETDGTLRRSLESAGFFAATIVEQRCLRLNAHQLKVHAIATQEQPPTLAAHPDPPPVPGKVGLQDVTRQSNGEETRSRRSSADGLKHLARNQTPLCAPPTSPGPFTFFSAAEIARCQLVELLNQTFVGTLDCPALNELRTPEEFMDSFLHDRDLTDDLQWYVAAIGEELAGCLFLTPLAEELMEITYLGLRPQFRQRGYGRYLVEHARNLAASHGAKMLLTAVDANNLPAVRIYRRSGFQVLQHMSVYLAGRVGQSRGYAWAM